MFSRKSIMLIFNLRAFLGLYQLQAKVQAPIHPKIEVDP